MVVNCEVDVEDPAKGNICMDLDEPDSSDLLSHVLPSDDVKTSLAKMVSETAVQNLESAVEKYDGVYEVNEDGSIVEDEPPVTIGPAVDPFVAAAALHKKWFEDDSKTSPAPSEITSTDLQKTFAEVFGKINECNCKTSCSCY